MATPAAASSNASDGVQQRDRTVELLTTGPVANPDERILSEVAAPRAVSSPQAQAATAPTHKGQRELVTETVRTRAPGPLKLQPLPVEELEAIEMDCGGINGLFIQQVRRHLGVSMKDISVRTKIGMAMLTAIEQEDRTQFQARVYMKGYLRQICRLLQLPVPQVPERYVERLGIE